MKTRSGHVASQREDELHDFIELLREEGVTRYLEIGARHGDTFYEVMRALPQGAFGVAVDLPGAAWGKPNSRSALVEAVAELCDAGYRAHAVFGDSGDGATCKCVHDLTGGELLTFDAMLIDGDHRYEGVKRDWHMWRTFARIVAFHDIAGEGVTSKHGNMPVEVPRFWSEIKDGFRHREIVGVERGMGLGVLWQ